MIIKKRCNMTFLVMWCHWFCSLHHMMPLESKTASFHSLGQGNWNEITRLFVSCDANCINNNTMLIELPMVQLHSLSQDNWQEVQHDVVVIWCHCHWNQCHMMQTAPSLAWLHPDIISIEMRYHVYFLSFVPIGISTGITICQWHWCHVMPLHMCWHHVMWTELSMVPLYSQSQRDKNDVQHYLFYHLTPL